MLRKLKKITLQVIVGANVGTIIMMILVGYSGRVNAAVHPTISSVQLAFPIFLAVNFAFLVFWAFVRLRMVLLPIAGFLAGFVPVREYFPINVPRGAPEGSIKVLSYNVWNYLGWTDRTKPNPITEYILEQAPDIACLQEANYGPGSGDSLLRARYQYSDTTRFGEGDVLAVYSRYPIVGKERVNYPSSTNHSTAFYVNIKGKVVMVVNNHFESLGLTEPEKQSFKTLVKGELKGDSVQIESEKLKEKVTTASARRAPQADAVLRYMRQRAYRSIICVGDFNDSPLSYTHHRLSEMLRDGFISSGNGPGISYHRNGFWVRIDHIMCSKDFTPYGCYVDRSNKNSDHYPIICWLKMN